MGDSRLIAIPSPDVDFDGWADATAAAIREGRWDVVDRDAVAEELEGLSRSDFHAVRNRLRVLIAHLLKWAITEQARENSWRRTIRDQRDEIRWLLDESPSLEARVLKDERLLRWAWSKAREDAAEELMDVTEDDFPPEPLWNLKDEILSPGWWPGPFNK